MPGRPSTPTHPKKGHESMTKRNNGNTNSKDYNVLVAEDASSLSSLVNEAMANGFEPVGGVTVATGRESPEEDEHEIWAQAVKRA